MSPHCLSMAIYMPIFTKTYETFSLQIAINVTCKQLVYFHSDSHSKTFKILSYNINYVNNISK